MTFTIDRETWEELLTRLPASEQFRHRAALGNNDCEFVIVDLHDDCTLSAELPNPHRDRISPYDLAIQFMRHASEKAAYDYLFTLQRLEHLCPNNPILMEARRKAMVAYCHTFI